MGILALHDLQDDPVDNQVVGIGLHPEHVTRENPNAILVGLGQNFIRFRKPISGVPIRRTDVDLIPTDLIRQLHQHLGLGDVPIVKFIHLGRVSAGKGIEVDVLEGVGNADQDRANQQLERDCGNDNQPEFAPRSLHQEAHRGDGQDEHRTVEEIEMPPTVIKDRPPDDREEQKGPDEDDANEQILGLARQFFALHAAE